MSNEYGNRYPQNNYAHALDESINFNELMDAKELMLLERHENFERELLDKKLEVLTSLADSINNVANAINKNTNCNK